MFSFTQNPELFILTNVLLYVSDKRGTKNVNGTRTNSYNLVMTSKTQNYDFKDSKLLLL